jgi:hypothetical protein
VIEDGMLRFLDREYRPARAEGENPTFWNGHPKPKLLQKVSIRSVIEEEISRGAMMHRPGEVRS